MQRFPSLPAALVALALGAAPAHADASRINDDMDLGWYSYRDLTGQRHGGVRVENDARFRHRRKGQLDTAEQNYFDTNRLPGISATVIHRGNVIYRRGFGMADVANHRPAHSETIFDIASLAKPVGGVLAARVANRPVRAGGTPTLDLSQTTRSYSTHGFTFVGAVIEGATNRTLPKLLQPEITGPLDLASLRMQYASATLPNADRACRTTWRASAMRFAAAS